jgi:two-component system chemotaxis sensor kinase CheA
MVPISQIFSRFPALSGTISKSLNKKVELVIEGEETELDKSVIEDLLDPLMHSVRNALDHGVESPEERIAAGKPEQGTVHLRASNEGQHDPHRDRDDGKGIDVDKVKHKAVERGLLHPARSSRIWRPSTLISRRDSAPPRRSPTSPAAAWVWTWFDAR